MNLSLPCATLSDCLATAKRNRRLTFFAIRNPETWDGSCNVIGALYAREYRYDERFEALVAEIVAKFVQSFDARSDRCWIAEREDENVGSVFLVRHTKTVAKLRLLLVEPGARGMGIGGRLVQECVRFAKQVGYKKIILWTQSELKAARAIYEKARFQLVKEEAHQSWSRNDLVAETWELGI